MGSGGKELEHCLQVEKDTVERHPERIPETGFFLIWHPKFTNMESSFASLVIVRKLMAQTIANLSPEQLYAIPQGFSNNLIWNLAHAQVTLELLSTGLCGLPLSLDQSFVDRFRKGSQPPITIGTADIALVMELMHSQPERFREEYASGKFQGFKPYQTSTGMMLSKIEDAIAFIPVHEGIHLGLMMNIKKFV